LGHGVQQVVLGLAITDFKNVNRSINS